MAEMFVLPFRPAFDSNGKTIPGAQAWFTLAGTNTPAEIYADEALTTPLANPLLANGMGRFPRAYLDADVDYRLRVYGSAATVGVDTPLEEYDPYIPSIPGINGTNGTNGAKGDPGSPGEGYPTRAAMAAATPAPSNLDDAYLTEAGREGKFVFSTANLSAQVALDTYQARYVAPSSAPSGASGAWVRVLPLGKWQASWAGCDPALTDNHLRLNSMVAIMPAGSVFVGMGRESANRLPVSGTVMINKRLLLTQWGTKPAAGWVSSSPCVQVAASKVEIEHSFLQGRRTNPVAPEGSGTPTALTVSAVAAGYASETHVDDVVLRDVEIDGSLGMAGFGHSLTAGTIAPVRRLRLEGVKIRSDYACCNLIGVDDLYIDGNCDFEMDGVQTGIEFTQPLRIYGSGGYVGPCRLKAWSTGASNFVAARVVGAQFSSGLLRNNSSVTFDGTRMLNCNTAIFCDCIDGMLTVDGVKMDSPTAGTDSTIAVVIQGDGALPIKDVIVRDSNFRGVHLIANIAGAPRSVRFKNNLFVGNNSTTGGKIVNADGATTKYFEWIGNEAILKSKGAYNPMQALINVASGCLARVHDNTWGEIDGGGTDGFIKIWTTGAGKVITQRGQTPQDASLGSSVVQGANDSNVAGTFAAATA